MYATSPVHHTEQHEQHQLRDRVAPFGAAVVEYADTDASGEPRLVGEGPVRGPSMRIITAFDTTPALRRFVWRQNPACLECGAQVASPDDAGYVPTPDGFRITCRTPCLAAAIARTRRGFEDAAQRDSAATVAAVSAFRDLRLVPDPATGEG